MTQTTQLQGNGENLRKMFFVGSGIRFKLARRRTTARPEAIP